MRRKHVHANGSRGQAGIEIADAQIVDRAGVDMQLRVIVVTTRAALRHANDDPLQRAAILARGRSLLESVAERTSGDGRHALDQAFAQLDSLSTE
jgi:hypothetical protein